MNTIEEAVLKRAQGKTKLEQIVVQKGKFKSVEDAGAMQSFQKEELDRILKGGTFNTDHIINDMTDDDFDKILDRSSQPSRGSWYMPYRRRLNKCDVL